MGWEMAVWSLPVKDDSVITLVKKNDKMEVGASDRVEIFLKKDDSMDPYYCLELDADGRALATMLLITGK